jgi:hypothetical protein
MPMPLSADLKRIDDALQAALEVFNRLSSRQLNVDRKQGGDPVTEADRTSIGNRAAIRSPKRIDVSTKRCGRSSPAPGRGGCPRKRSTIPAGSARIASGSSIR